MATLIFKAYRSQKPLLVFVTDDALADALDRRLWTTPPTGFIPHVRGESPLADETPIQISRSVENSPQHDRLFNLSNEVPPGFSRFASLIEVVGESEEDKIAGRQRVKFYKDRGYEITFFNLGD